MKNYLIVAIVALMAGWTSSSITAQTYSIAIKRPNGDRIPKILGASGDLALTTGYDYFKWYGITQHRTWFKPSFSSLADNSGVTSAKTFDAAIEDIRKDPMRQATSADHFIDWAHFHKQRKRAKMPETMKYLADRNIESLITNTRFISDTPITDDWEKRFKYWKYWYTMVYHFASQHDVTMYAFRNEPHAHIDYDPWESHWLVCADAMRKAMADVNANFDKTLKLNICGPNCPGVYWDYKFSHPDQDIHCWGSVSWKKIKYDVHGKYRKRNPMNYGMYHYHRYGHAAGAEKILLNARKAIANARNDPSRDIPLVITEYNTNTSGTFNKRKRDTEDLNYGVTMAQILHASAVHGKAGLGDDGGIFVFKLGAGQSGKPLVGLGNTLTYSSQHKPNNYGGITRGGACFQMYARHFSGGKPLLPVSVTSGADAQRRTVAVVDEENKAYYIYGSNCAGKGVSVSIDLRALKVKVGAFASLQRVDKMNTGQVTDIIKLSRSKRVEFDAPNNTAFLIKVPMAGDRSSYQTVSPSDDATKKVVDTGLNGSASTMAVSTHHSKADLRQVGMMRFRLDGTKNTRQAFLKLAGRNSGVDPSKREILHVYAVKDVDWNEGAELAWADAPGLGKYHIDNGTMGATDGTGDMVDIEDNYAGVTNGVGTGLGIWGEFVGAVSFHSSDFVPNFLDVTDYLKSVSNGTPTDVTFVVVRIVRYNVNEYSNDEYYTLGDYHYDERSVQIATKEHSDKSLRPKLVISTVDNASKK